MLPSSARPGKIMLSTTTIIYLIVKASKKKKKKMKRLVHLSTNSVYVPGPGAGPGLETRKTDVVPASRSGTLGSITAPSTLGYTEFVLQV